MKVVDGWHPVAASDDLPVGHVYQTRLCDRPLAVWRSTSGDVNIWEDRCPHRGVRLSIGSPVGNELRCQYHAWRFASGSGACTFIPAHPDRKPAAAIRATVLPAVEHGGLVWTQLAENERALPALSAGPGLPAGVVLRALPVNRSAAAVEAALATADMAGARFFVQPIGPERSVIRGVADDEGTLVDHDVALERLRRELEAA